MIEYLFIQKFRTSDPPTTVRPHPQPTLIQYKWISFFVYFCYSVSSSSVASPSSVVWSMWSGRSSMDASTQSSGKQFKPSEKIIHQIGESAATATTTTICVIQPATSFQTSGRLAGQRHPRVGKQLQSGFARSAGQSNAEGELRGTTVAAAQFGEYLQDICLLMNFVASTHS